jgi:transcription elongation factor GreA
MERFPVTPEGHVRLIARLRHLKSVVRGQIVKDIEEARAHGDISENSEYEDAKERQSMCEGQIALLEGQVAAAEVIDIHKITPSDRVIFGTTVTMENVDSGVERTWRIVGVTEADVDNGQISYKSPVGKALIGKHEGDEVVVPAPNGRQRWEIVQVQYI